MSRLCFDRSSLQQVKPQRDNQKKRKQMLTPTDEPESKINRTETESKESEVTPGTSSVQGSFIVLFLFLLHFLRSYHSLVFMLCVLEQVEKNGEASEPQAPADEVSR